MTSKFGGRQTSAHQFGKNLVGDSEALRGQSHTIAIHFDEALRTQRLEAGAHTTDLLVQFGVVGAFDAMQIDSFQLAQAKEKLFFERLRGSDRLDLLARRTFFIDGSDVAR